MPPPPVPCQRCRCHRCTADAVTRLWLMVAIAIGVVAIYSAALAALWTVATRTGWLRPHLCRILLDQ